MSMKKESRPKRRFSPFTIIFYVVSFLVAAMMILAYCLPAVSSPS